MVASLDVEDTRALVHRIRNDLQLASSLLHAEQSEVVSEDARRALQAMDRRLLAINFSYAGDDLSQVSLPRYLEQLCGSLGHTVVTCASRTLPALAGRRLGMLLVEVLGAAGAEAKVSLTEDADRLRLEIVRARAAKGGARWLDGLPRELAMDLVEQLDAKIVTEDARSIALVLAAP
jgi:two-component sensor histidine kinase